MCVYTICIYPIFTATLYTPPHMADCKGLKVSIQVNGRLLEVVNL